jgi:hypothetical protein
VLEEIKEMFKDLVTRGNQFGLKRNESATKILIEPKKRRHQKRRT